MLDKHWLLGLIRRAKDRVAWTLSRKKSRSKRVYEP